MADKKTPEAIPAEPIKAGATSKTPETGATPSETPADTLVAEPPVKDGAGKRSAADNIKKEASKLGNQAADRARGFADEGKQRATGALDEFAKLMTDAAGDVDERIGPEYGKYARSAAEGISGFSESLRGKEIDDLIAEAGEFVKKSPAIAVGTAAALGFVFARLLKSGIDAVSETDEA
ncbi:hypothetical protein [Stakelama tenebrarum]|uniref:Nutrient deprivation-induced protein n=1 Tax=Stakelama tenebrarum TaxID=2711215 RepID=A0A6G6Y6Y1_9SPHN|nr:hypothetical protein [Sphingosinithalassobacter tenebrarum]QIG80468.1 hypothetical protein G5C33_12215 [Sphingosinithalassobacter tenebrarum]